MLSPGSMELSPQFEVSLPPDFKFCSEQVQWILDQGIEVDDPERLAYNILDFVRPQCVGRDFFDDPNRLIILASAASVVEEGVWPDATESSSPELHFAWKIAELITKGFKSTEKAESPVNEEAELKKLEFYHRYRNAYLSTKIQNLVDSSEFDDLRYRLGIMEGHMPEIVVVNAFTESDAALVMPAYWHFGNDEDELLELNRENHRIWTEEGRRNRKAIEEEIGNIPPSYIAWACRLNVDGDSYIILPAPQMMILTGDSKPRFPSASKAEAERALLEHEYVHTYGLLRGIDHSNLLGMALEEFRAEHFSGNRRGYEDVKRFGHTLKAHTGVDLAQLLEPEYMSYDRDRFILNLAQRLGLENIADIFSMIPEAYAKYSKKGDSIDFLSKYHKSIDHVGEKITERYVKKHGTAKRNANLRNFTEEAADLWIDQMSPNFETSFYEFCEKKFGRDLALKLNAIFVTSHEPAVELDESAA